MKLGIEASRKQRGFTTIDLLIGSAVALLAVSGAVSVFSASQKAYSSVKGISSFQEESSSAMEGLSSDIRGAGGTGCRRDQRYSVISSPSATQASYWSQWSNGFIAIDDGTDFTAPAMGFGSGFGDRLAGTAAISVGMTSVDSAKVTEESSGATGHLAVGAGGLDSLSVELLMVCDTQAATAFYVTFDDKGNLRPGGGNCTNWWWSEVLFPCVEFPHQTAPPDKRHAYGRNATISRPVLARWYIGANDDGEPALFKRYVRENWVSEPIMIADGVTSLSAKVLAGPAQEYVAANWSPEAPEWRQVRSVRLSLKLKSDSGSRLGSREREITETVFIRNHAP